MMILTQERSLLANFISVEYAIFTPPSSDTIHYLAGSYGIQDEVRVTIGKYKSRERCLMVLHDVALFFSQHPTSVYELPKE